MPNRPIDGLRALESNPDLDSLEIMRHLEIERTRSEARIEAKMQSIEQTIRRTEAKITARCEEIIRLIRETKSANLALFNRLLGPEETQRQLAEAELVLSGKKVATGRIARVLMARGPHPPR